MSINKLNSTDTQNNRLAVIAVIVEETTAVAEINALLSEYGKFIVGRMGLPNVKENVNVISIVLSAPLETINALTGKLGSIRGVNAKTLFSKV